MFWKEASKRSAAVTLEERMEKDNSGVLESKGIESLDESIEASKTENTEQKSGTVSIEERAKDENGFINLMKLGTELKKEEERKEEPKKEEKNPKPERTFPSTENVYHFHPIAFVNHMKKIFGEKGECKCEARVRAFMSMLRVGEGTEDDKGYERIVGGSHFEDYGKDFSDHPNVLITLSPNLKSTAAGAYQITQTNWNDTPFVNWRKKQGLSDFSPESQDKYCYYLLAKKKKAIDLIKKGYITEAIHKVRTEWASLPGSGHGQREEKLSNIINKYLEFYKVELKGESKLHLKKGELDKLEFSCTCNENDSVDCSCGQDHYDVSDMMVFYDQGTGNSDCNKTCKAIMRQIGVHAEGATEANSHSYYQLAVENSARNGFDFDEKDSKNGIAYLDKALKNGHPVLVGVDHTFKYRKFGKINEDSTDHYVIIVGKGCLNGKTIYKFWDVGTKWGGKGDYYFTLDGTKLTSCSRKNKNYTVTQIRRNLNGKNYVQYK